MDSTVSITNRTRRHQAAIRIRKAKHRDATAIESLLYESFLEYERAYTPEAFHITTPEKREIESRIKHWTVWVRSEEHTSELQSPYDLVCRLLLEKKKEK